MCGVCDLCLCYVLQGQITDGNSLRGEGPKSLSAPALLRSIYNGQKNALRHLIVSYAYIGGGKWSYRNF